jgi:hypothetical protein
MCQYLSCLKHASNTRLKKFTVNDPINPVVVAEVELLAAWLALLAHVFAAVLRVGDSLSFESQRHSDNSPQQRHFAIVYCRM